MTQDNSKDIQSLRFLPVKQTSDLLLVMSNLYSLDHGALIMSPMVGGPLFCCYNFCGLCSFVVIFFCFYIQVSSM